MNPCFSLWDCRSPLRLIFWCAHQGGLLAVKTCEKLCVQNMAKRFPIFPANEKTSLYQTIHSRTGVRRTQKSRANTGVCPYKTVLLHNTRPCKRTLL